jgi:hypothetical protein
MLRRNRFGKISRLYIGLVRNGISRIKENVMATGNLREYWALQKGVVIIYVAWRISTHGDHCETSRQYRENLTLLEFLIIEIMHKSR